MCEQCDVMDEALREYDSLVAFERPQTARHFGNLAAFIADRYNIGLQVFISYAEANSGSDE